jgi:hypothetical protein
MLVDGLHEIGTAAKAQRPAGSVLRRGGEAQTALPPPDAEADAKPRDTHEGSDAKPLSDQEKEVGVDDGVRTRDFRSHSRGEDDPEESDG